MCPERAKGWAESVASVLGVVNGVEWEVVEEGAREERREESKEVDRVCWVMPEEVDVERLWEIGRC